MVCFTSASLNYLCVRCFLRRIPNRWKALNPRPSIEFLTGLFARSGNLRVSLSAIPMSRPVISIYLEPWRSSGIVSYFATDANLKQDFAFCLQTQDTIFSHTGIQASVPWLNKYLIPVVTTESSDVNHLFCVHQRQNQFLGTSFSVPLLLETTTAVRQAVTLPKIEKIFSIEVWVIVEIFHLYCTLKCRSSYGLRSFSTKGVQFTRQ